MNTLNNIVNDDAKIAILNIINTIEKFVIETVEIQGNGKRNYLIKLIIYS